MSGRARRRGKRDNNHKEIFGAIRAIVPAKDLADAGDGVPDGIAWINGGWHLFDVKNPDTAYGRAGLNDIQKKWSVRWSGGPVYLIHTIDEAIRFAQGKFDTLEKFPTDKLSAKDLNVVRGTKKTARIRSGLPNLLAKGGR